MKTERIKIPDDYKEINPGAIPKQPFEDRRPRLELPADDPSQYPERDRPRTPSGDEPTKTYETYYGDPNGEDDKSDTIKYGKKK